MRIQLRSVFFVQFFLTAVEDGVCARLKGAMSCLISCFKVKMGKNLNHTYSIPDNPLSRYEKYMWHKALFVFSFWCLSEDNVCVFQDSMYFHSFHPTKNSYSIIIYLFIDARTSV